MTENERFKAVRLKLGLNQKEISAAIGIGQSTISAIESGTSEVTRQTKLLLNCLYGLSMEYWTDQEDIHSHLHNIKKSYISKEVDTNDIKDLGLNNNLEHKLLLLKVKRLELEKESIAEELELYRKAVENEKQKPNKNEKRTEQK